MAGQTTSACSTGPCPNSPQLQLYQTIIFATPVLFAFLLLLLFCVLYIRRRRSANLQMRVQISSRAQFFSQLQVDHGLSKSFRQRLPTFPFDDKFPTTHEDAQCAVCLGDYQLNEKLQQLPVCKHSFHVECIDVWLAKNNTCPMCRASLGGGQQQTQSHMVRIPSMGRENRQWEERVMSGALDVNGLDGMRGDATIGFSNSGVSVAESTARFSIEHASHIERS